MEEMIGISIGSQLTKFSAREALPQKENGIYDYNDFKIKLDLNDILDRVLPTTLQIKENNILIGQTTQLGHKKYYLSTFENLLRLIDLNDKEKEYFITLENYDENYNCFKFTINGNEQRFKGVHLLIEFLSQLDKKIKDKLKTNEKQNYIFTLPDFFIYNKKKFSKILSSAELKNDLPIISESTALTMYYGYLNYDELDYDKKYILFIDSGHSKTSFVLSEFSKKEFAVKEVENIPFLGGRDFNKKIFEHCLKIYEEQNKKELKVTPRVKIRFMEEIEKKRKILSINDGIDINILSIEKETDFNYYLEKEEFENIISEELNIFKEKFKLFYQKVKDKYKISKIEIAGQLMRTPKLKEIVTQISSMNISETIFLDLCHSLGALLFGTFILKKRKFQELECFKSYNMYTILYSFDGLNKEILIEQGKNIPIKGRIEFKIENNKVIVPDELYCFYYIEEIEKKGESFIINTDEIKNKNKLKGLKFYMNDSFDLLFSFSYKKEIQLNTANNYFNFSFGFFNEW